MTKTSDRQHLSPSELKAEASAWYERQVTLLAECHGAAWPENREWLEGYLKEQLRQRLIALGWRPKA
jgi:hypothetical protein